MLHRHARPGALILALLIIVVAATVWGEHPGSALAQATRPPQVPGLVTVTQNPSTLDLTASKSTPVSLRVGIDPATTSECRGTPKRPIDLMIFFDSSASAEVYDEARPDSASNWEHTRTLGQALVQLMLGPIYTVARPDAGQSSRVGLVVGNDQPRQGLTPRVISLTNDLSAIDTQIAGLQVAGDPDRLRGIDAAAQCCS